MSIPDVIQTIAFLLGAFAITFAIVAWISRAFFMGLWQKPLWAILAILSGITHFILATISVLYVGAHLKNEGEAGMLWFIFIYGDFPISYLLRPIENALEHAFQNSRATFIMFNNVIPYALFATLGSLQYSLWGALLGKLLERLRG